MQGDAVIQFENEKFQRIYSGVMLSIIDETEQAFLYNGFLDSEIPPEEILVLDSAGVCVFADENGIHVSGYVADGKGSYNRCALDFRLYL